MRRFAAIFLSMILLAAASPGAAGSKTPVKILALGTSLTQGYGLPPGTEFPVQLEAALRKDGIAAEVINAGVSGDTSAGGLARLDWSLASHPAAAIVELGSNDMLRGIPPSETEKNLRAILGRLRAAHVKILLAGMKAQRNLGAEYVEAFDAIYPRLAHDYPDVVFYPFMLEGVALKPKLNQADGMHPNPAGVKVMVAKMLPYVEKMLGVRKMLGP
jgi:acyl-CoA thioesterase-1